jgi:thiamine-phosphate diphosphorylase
MSANKLTGVYVITDDNLTPDETIFAQVEAALKGGAKIIQLRDKYHSDEDIKTKAKAIQSLCKKYDATFVLNDKIDMAIELQCDGLHIGKSDHHRFDEIRKEFKGVIGVSCYDDIDLAKEFQNKGADYVAFGSFYHSPTKPSSNIIPLDILSKAKQELAIPICAIGGLNQNNIDEVLSYQPDMISLISDIWQEDVEKKTNFYTNKLNTTQSTNNMVPLKNGTFLKDYKMTTLKIALEWFLNPDHLPMIAGVVSKKYEEGGINLEIIAPDEHYDGFEQLKAGEIDIHCNEPLHLFEHYYEGLKSLGCFFETRGGVMVRADRVEKLKNNEPIKITTPASNPVTNKIGFEILKRYAIKEGFELTQENVTFVETDFWHINNMKNDESFDGAWLCFYNFEGIEAEEENFDNLFIDQFISPYPNFSALEFMSTDETVAKKGEAICKFIGVTNEMAQYCQDNVEVAKAMFYEYSKEEKSDLMDKIIEDTIPRFETDIKPDSQRWLELSKFLEELDVVKLDTNQYKRIWK